MDEGDWNEFKSKVNRLSREELLALAAVLARDAGNLAEEAGIVEARLAELTPRPQKDD